jgi:hypothetical protein
VALIKPRDLGPDLGNRLASQAILIEQLFLVRLPISRKGLN